MCSSATKTLLTVSAGCGCISAAYAHLISLKNRGGLGGVAATDLLAHLFCSRVRGTVLAVVEVRSHPFSAQKNILNKVNV
jgi:hypothetical protein